MAKSLALGARHHAGSSPVYSTNGDEALVDEHVLCKHEVVDSSSIISTK